MDTIISQWDSAYIVGIPEIDKQHQHLFRLAAQFQNELVQGASRKTSCKTLHQLREYAKNHFSNEEQFFRNHPQFDFHQQIHRAFILKISQLEQDYQEWKIDLASDILDFLHHWLITHLTDTDRQFLNSEKNVQESNIS